jgi:hypothetical protein
LGADPGLFHTFADKTALHDHRNLGDTMLGNRPQSPGATSCC